MRRRHEILLGTATALAAALFLLPLAGLLLATPWSRLGGLLASASVADALRLSATSSLGAAAAAVVLGLPLAVWLSRGESALRTAVRIVVMLPIVLPPIVAGIALLCAFGRRGLAGAPVAQWTGWSLPFTTAAAVVAAAYMGLPFFVLSAEAGLRAFDRRFAGAAATLGAGPLRVFVTVTVPMTAPALGAGLLLCWARALGEFCATQMFAGNLAGTTRTLPLACAVAMEADPDLALALSSLLALVSALVLVLLRRAWARKP
ncbi:MAG: ABC transporter permease subunit [Planctomycetota bacterium]